MELVQRAREIIAQRRITKVQFCRELEVCYLAGCRWLSGATSPDVRNRKALAKWVRQWTRRLASGETLDV